MPSMFWEALLILLLILLNGVLAMAEIAVVSARKTRLQQLAEDGDEGAAAAFALAEAPNPFLSTIQIGITLIGILAGAFSGATIGAELGARLSTLSVIGNYGNVLGFGVVVAIVTYLSLIIGELVPKRIALAAPERIASAMARPMRGLARLCGPLERFLTGSTEMVIRLLRLPPVDETPVTEDEIRGLIEKGTEAGVFAEAEQDMVEGVLDLGDRRVATLMTPRNEVVWLDASDSPEEIRSKLSASPHARYPVARGDLEGLVGVVHAKDLLVQLLSNAPVNLESVLRPPLIVPGSLTALKALEQFRSAGQQLAFVVDEHGGIQGLFSLNDLVSAVVGDIAEPGVPGDPEAIQREDGSWLLDGRISIERLEELLKVEDLEDGDEHAYSTLAGFLIHQFGRIPTVGQHLTWRGLRFEVVDLDGRRVDRVLVSREP